MEFRELLELGIIGKEIVYAGEVLHPKSELAKMSMEDIFYLLDEDAKIKDKKETEEKKHQENMSKILAKLK